MKRLDFGKKLIEVRKEKGLTQLEVAEMCKITTRTIQRIETGVVRPRTFTIKLISETLGFDSFETSDSVNMENSNMESHNILWYLKDLFNLKTNAMRKISILSTSILMFAFLFTFILGTRAQSSNIKNDNCLVIQYNMDYSINRIEAVFSNSLTPESLVRVKNELKTHGITIKYKKVEFDKTNHLLSIDCEVDSNDGFKGSFSKKPLIADDAIGFFRDYSARIPFCAGRCGLKVQ